MKIAVVVNELNIRGGTHKQVLRLCQYLEKEKIDFVLCTKYYEAEKTYPGFKDFNILYLYTGTCGRTAAGRNIAKRIRNYVAEKKESRALYDLIPNDVNIINVHDVSLEDFIRLSTGKGKKVIWQINDLSPVFIVGASKTQKDSLYKKYKRREIKNIAKKVAKITVNVTKNKNRVKKFLNRDAEVLYCGVDRNSLLDRHYFEIKEQFNLLSMGVFLSYRNYETLIEVIKSMREKGKNINLNIIGNTELDKNYTNKIHNMIDEYGMKEFIKICGQVDDKTYAELFNQADAFAFVNIDQSWGLAVFEAMSCGLPVLVSNSVGATELLHDGKDAIIVDPFDINAIEGVLERLMTDRDYYNEISDNAFHIVKEYTWDSMYNSKMVEIFRKL